MADFRSIETTCEAIVALLRANYDASAFGDIEAQFSVYNLQNFRGTNAITEGVSLFLYRVKPNTSIRLAPGRQMPDGNREPPRLPVDLFFFLTAWAPTPSLEHRLVGWFMRVMEDFPILPAGMLNAPPVERGFTGRGVFLEQEAVELSLGELNIEDLLRIWEVMIEREYHLSVPYVARRVEIESLIPSDEQIPVIERELEAGIPVGLERGGVS